MRFFNFSLYLFNIVFSWKNNFHIWKISFGVKISFSYFFLLRYLGNYSRDLAPRACFIIFLLTYDFLKFIFIRNIFIDLVVIRGEYMGKVFSSLGLVSPKKMLQALFWEKSCLPILAKNCLKLATLAQNAQKLRFFAFLTKSVH